MANYIKYIGLAQVEDLARYGFTFTPVIGQGTALSLVHRNRRLFRSLVASAFAPAGSLNTTSGLSRINQCGQYAPFGRRTAKPLRGLSARCHKR